MGVALGILRAMHVRHIVSSTNFFSLLSNKGKKKVIQQEMCFSFAVQCLSGTFCILRKSERDMIENAYRSSCKVPVIFVRF